MSTELYYRKRRRAMSEINVVPYIDVMLVLLVIFMITAPLLNLGVEVDLPRGDADPMEPVSEPMMITVTREGDLYLDMGDSPELMDEETLVERVSAVVRRNPDVQVLVGGDQESSYRSIYSTMVLLQRAGVPRVGLMGDPDDGD